MAMTLALNYGKFRRYVTREEVAEWGKNFELDALKEAKKNLKGRISEMGSIKKAWEKPVQVRTIENTLSHLFQFSGKDRLTFSHALAALPTLNNCTVTADRAPPWPSV